MSSKSHISLQIESLFRALPLSFLLIRSSNVVSSLSYFQQRFVLQMRLSSSLDALRRSVTR